jgi:predicted nucleic acid-binding protein
VSYLIDTSIWVELFRHPHGGSGQAFRTLIESDAEPVLGCPPVRMELSLDQNDLRRRRILQVYDGFETADIRAEDFDLAAELHRSVRRSGNTVRALPDCVIAAIALRNDAIVVHNDVDFDRIAQVATTLKVLRLPRI